MKIEFKIKKYIELSLRKEKILNNEEIEIEPCKNLNHGDLSSNIAFKIAKKTKESPILISEKIANNISNNDLFEKVEAVSGFVNFSISKNIYKQDLSRIIKEKDSYGSNLNGKNKTMVIDYSSPNIAKSFGVGHLRSTIIGQAIYNIYKFSGWKTIGDNHVGDWGTQFGKLIYQIEEKNLEDKIKKLSIKDLENLYVDFHKKAEENTKLSEKGKEWFKKLEKGDNFAKKVWKNCVRISMKEFKRVYKILGIKIDFSFGESFYRKKSQKIIKELKLKNITERSEQTLIIRFKQEEIPPVIIEKSDGATTYFARDLAAIKYRIKKWNPDLIVYEVGSDQSLYFNQIFKTFNLLGWSEKLKLFHVAHGLIRWNHGKFSTRKGETIHLEKILEESVKRAKQIIKDKDISEKEKERISKIVGIGAVKYNDLSQHYSKDIVFDWDKVLNLKGNSGPYIQYTFVRTQSVLKKHSKKIEAFEIGLLEKEEKEILVTIRQFPYIVEKSANEFSPSLISNFLFDLSQKYNSFYDIHKIIGHNKEKLRIAITFSTGQTIKNGLKLLGIDVPYKM
jgi:arginyl-tRNA synthetase